MTPSELLHDLTTETPLRRWFLDMAHNYAVRRGGIGQDLAEQALTKTIAALERKAKDGNKPIPKPAKVWLRSFVRNAWRDVTKSFVGAKATASTYTVPRCSLTRAQMGRLPGRPMLEALLDTSYDEAIRANVAAFSERVKERKRQLARGTQGPRLRSPEPAQSMDGQSNMHLQANGLGLHGFGAAP